MLMIEGKVRYSSMDAARQDIFLTPSDGVPPHIFQSKCGFFVLHLTHLRNTIQKSYRIVELPGCE